MYCIAPAILLIWLLFGSSVTTGSELPPHRTVVNLRTIDPDVPRPLPVDPTKPNITLGFLSSFKDFGKLIAGAIPLAVDMVNNDHELLPNHNLKWDFLETGKPNTAGTIKSMTRMKEKGVAAFIGPDHSCVSEALVAAAWDIPMITYTCVDRAVSDKSIFSTFARTLPPSSKVSKSIISLLKHFNWNRLMLLVQEKHSNKQTAEALKLLAIMYDIDIVETFNLPGDYLTKENSTLKDIIRRTYKRTRIYVVLADYYTLVDLVRFMHEKGLFDAGEYIVIALEEEEVYDPNRDYQYFRRDM